MSHVIYHRTSFHLLTGAAGHQMFTLERTARGVLTRAVARDKTMVKADWIVAPYKVWRDAEPMVTTYSLMDEKNERPIQIRASQRGTFMDPATERYHSM